MKRRKNNGDHRRQAKQHPAKALEKPIAKRLLVLGLPVALGAGAVAAFLMHSSPMPKDAVPKRRPAGTLTFSRDIAPILRAHCANCHHAGGAAPFALTSFADAKKRASEIAEVT